ncbi:hypothetical protein [Salmonirosea aquatica]|uniref:Uncharacterized protein n=1 Tax=Salmonirosea aquatica TaxID=2654236 RepID=A0A7C9BJS9_9BACT|nr:hypothetical protein [Cytophagaceae bacterium SJW1-29]
MKYRLIFIFGWLTLSLAFSPLYAQVVSPTLPGDTLPAIRMKFEPVYLIFLLVPIGGLFVGGHSYQINGENKLLASYVKPYFNATNDPLLADLYGRHKRNRIVWYSATATGTVVLFAGFIRAISSVFSYDPGFEDSFQNYLIVSGGLAAAGIGARIVCFRQLRKAVNYYNFEYAGKDPSVSLHVGLPSATPAGLALYLKF